jgi:hypothetical protein
MEVLRGARNYLKEGGTLYFTTIGWYHHAGSHTGIPFGSVFFSDKTILDYMRWKVSRPGYQPGPWDSDPPIARWQGIQDLRDRPGEQLNKITIRQMKNLVKAAPFREGKVHVIGFRNPKVRWVNPLRHIPVVNEVFHSGVVGVLRK